MIKHLALRNLRNSEYLQFMNALSRILRSGELQCDEQISALTAAVSHLENLYARDPEASLTDELTRLDDLRDDLIIGLMKLFEAHAHNPDAAMRGAATELSGSLECYGKDIAQQAYGKESASIRGLLHDWHTRPELHSAIHKLGVQSWAERLRDANEQFIEKYRTQQDTLDESTMHDSLKTVRNVSNKAYSDLRERINSFYTIHNLTGPWGAAIREMNQLIDSYQARIIERSGMSEEFADKSSEV